MLRQKAPKLVTVIILTTITAIFWVFFSLYQVLTTKSEIEVPEVLLKDINPTLDITTFNVIQQKLFFEEGQVQPIPLSEEPTRTTPAVTQPPVQPSLTQAQVSPTPATQNSITPTP